MLVEKTRTTEVIGEVITDRFIYGVSYSLNGNNLIRLNCGVSRRVFTEVETPEGKQKVEESAYIGSLTCEGGNKQVYLQENEEIAPHVEVFEAVLAEVRATLVPIPVKVSK